MKREKQEKLISYELIDELLKPGRTAGDVNGLLKEITKVVLERVLEGELTEHLGYPKHDAADATIGNSRNGVTRKLEVSSSLIGEITDGVMEQARAWQNLPLEPF